MSSVLAAAIMAAALAGSPPSQPSPPERCVITIQMRWDGPVLRYDYGWKTCRLRAPALRRGLVR